MLEIDFRKSREMTPDSKAVTRADAGVLPVSRSFAYFADSPLHSAS